MRVLRTPEERFAGLADFPFTLRYLDLDGVRMAYVDEGAPDSPVVLLLHGEPTWSYLYRKMIPPLVAAGFRAVAPDLIGFGRSDKPLEGYTYQRHVEWLRGFVHALDLRGITLFCHDWGGLLGVRLAAEEGERFARVCASNTYLPTGDREAPLAFKLWRAFARYSPVLPIGRIVQAGSVSRVDPRPYDAPFPDASYKAGARAFPALVPTRPDDPASEPNRAAWRALEKWEKPFLCLWGARDPISRGADRALKKRIPGAQGQPHAVLPNAGHFIQEDAGPELAQRLIAWR